MTRTVLPLLAALLAAGSLPAQAPKPDPARDAERAEDVEVLRRILNRALDAPGKVTAHPYQWLPHANAATNLNVTNAPLVAQFPYHATPQPLKVGTSDAVTYYQVLGAVTDPNAARAAVGPFDGVYLPGHGVAFTLRVPEAVRVTLDPPEKASHLAETCRKCHDAEPVSRTALEPGDPPAPQTEWDRTRQELHGASAAPPKVVARLTREQVCDPGTLANQIIAKLHGNAGRVRHLAAGDRVTVVVTFDGQAGSPRLRQAIDPTTGNLVDVANAVARPAGKPGFTPEESRQLTLGDLHLKQGKAKEAIAAYEQGLARYREPVYRTSLPNRGVADAAVMDVVNGLQKGVRDVYARLAQAYLAAGDPDKAAAALDMARTFKVDLVSGPARTVPVPAKLIVSIAKADIDRAGGDAAAFRKAVTVETVGFPPADRPKK